MKPVIGWLRSRSHMSVIYLDDFLCLAATPEECGKNVDATTSLLESLGFVINWRKSNVIPSTRCRYLGFILDSIDMTVELPEEKRRGLITRITVFEAKSSCTIKGFAQLIGSLVASCPGVEYGGLHCKLFERAKIDALRCNSMDYEAVMQTPSYLREEFSWWKLNLKTTRRKIRRLSFEREIFSDASLNGWGAFCGSEGARGNWTLEERTLHINYLELKAAFLALRSFAQDLSSCSILLWVDNTTALSYINKMGGVKFGGLHRLAKEIWDWCEARSLWIHASYIASSENVEADALSRVLNNDSEWELASYAYETIVQCFLSLIHI